jgi:transaldolase/glucose-6-phosphate isomerase
LRSGEFQRLIEQGISGVTSNPTIFEKAIAGSADYDQEIRTLARSTANKVVIYEKLAVQDIQKAADLLRPIYDRSSGIHGYASLEVSPLLADDPERTVVEARRLFSALGRPNVMIKVPATQQGIPAIRRLIAEGININVTLIFSVDTYQQVMDAYISGLEELSKKGAGVNRVASVASFFLSRIDTVVDARLEERLRQGQGQFHHLAGKAAIASAKMAYQLFKQTFDGERFRTLKTAGARVQRPLWASTGTKNPGYSDVMYIEPLIGPDTVNTIPPATLEAFLDHGRVMNTIDNGLAETEQVLADLGRAGISLESVTAKLLVDGVKSFADSFDKLLAGIEEKRTRLLAAEC